MSTKLSPDLTVRRNAPTATCREAFEITIRGTNPRFEGG